MADILPSMRKDLELFPFHHQGKQLILIRDHLGLVPEGRAIDEALYPFMALLDGKTTLRELQAAMIRQHGGMLVGSEEIKALIRHLDDIYLLDSERFMAARDRIVRDFSGKTLRPSSHAGRAYPENPLELRRTLDEILGSPASPLPLDGRPVALVSPHIDISAGSRGYGSAYRCLKGATPSRVVVLGVGHQSFEGLFAVTDKAFSTPLGEQEADKASVERLRSAGRVVIAPDDFAHRSEHSIEFQVIFLQHTLQQEPFKIVPILCGSLVSSLPEYSRSAYREKAAPFLAGLKEIAADPETLVVAGVDFSHIGPKFGHGMAARHLEGRSEAHDRSLLQHFVSLDAEGFWEESRKVRDQYNVCGFSALACLLEVLPPAEGRLLHYETWHEEATRSAVSFAAAVFTER